MKTTSPKLKQGKVEYCLLATPFAWLRAGIMSCLLVNLGPLVWRVKKQVANMMLQGEHEMF